MKKTLMGGLIVLAAFALTLTAQNTGAANSQVQGRGRGGAPYAWGDRNGDGICDFTGKPVGQRRGPMMSRGGRAQAWRGMGRGMGRAMGWGAGRGMYYLRMQNPQTTAAPTQPAPAPAK